MRRRGSRAALLYLGEDALSGYGEAADREVWALRSEGVRVEYRGWSGGREYELPAGVNPHSRDPLPSERARRGAPTIAHVFPERLPEIRAATRRGPLIAHTVWETDLLPTHWPAILNLADRVIVPTEWNRAAFVASGVTKPVVVVPYVVCDPVPGDRGVPLALPDDVVAFYTISRWDERKKPAAVIEAFLEAFTADDPVALVVKTTPYVQYPPAGPWGGQSVLVGTTMLEVARIVRNYPRPARVRVEIDDWTPERLAGLHTRGDCYVSLAHSEGWGLGAFDAAAYGNPIVMTGWGGQLEFLDADTAFLVDHDLAPVQYWPPHVYPTGQHWAVPRLEHAVEHMRKVAADLGAARRRAAPLKAKVLHEYSPARVVATLLDVVPELGLVTDASPSSVRDQPRPAPAAPGERLPHSGSGPAHVAGEGLIPRIAHFVFGLREEPEPFHLVHYLAIKSCLEVIKPEEVYLHCHHLPYGQYWDVTKARVIVQHVEPARAVSEFAYADRIVDRYKYAHHADFVRLDVLTEHGGLYADIDTLFVAPVPDELWHQQFVIGREADVVDPMTGESRPALSNALLMSVPGSRFVEAWRAEIGDALDGSWVAHSCFLAYDLASRLPADVHVEPQRAFHAFEPTAAGLSRLLEGNVADLDGVTSIHLAAHLWWEDERRDFSRVHAGMISEHWIRHAPVTYAIAARRFLPTDDLAVTARRRARRERG